MAAFALYFGAALVPAAYVLCVGRNGRLARWMLSGLAVQLIASVCVLALVSYCRRFGYTEWYWANALYIPVNVMSALYYGATPVLARLRCCQLSNPASPPQSRRGSTPTR